MLTPTTISFGKVVTSNTGYKVSTTLIIVVHVATKSLLSITVNVTAIGFPISEQLKEFLSILKDFIPDKSVDPLSISLASIT
uniref:phage holin family protein n=1 Tax=Tenacibaculum caenipelagi TaxID=1325435 RepID=UPI0037438734